MTPLTRQSIGPLATKLAARDPVLAPVLRSHGPPPMWKRSQTFATFVRIILEQQVSLSSAKSTFEGLSDFCGDRVTPSAVLEAGESGLRSLGFSRQKARYTCALAEDVQDERFRIATLRSMNDEAVREAITARLGLGVWSANVYLMMALLRPDVIPHGDLALAKGLTELDAGDYATEDRLAERTELWRPHRSVGVRMVWQAYLHRRGQTLTA